MKLKGASSYGSPSTILELLNNSKIGFNCYDYIEIKIMVEPMGIEPTTRMVQTSVAPKVHAAPLLIYLLDLEHHEGIEPSYLIWQTSTLPLC